MKPSEAKAAPRKAAKVKAMRARSLVSLAVLKRGEEASMSWWLVGPAMWLLVGVMS